ncbi:protein O-mannosyl-transferase family [Candidatus Eisenbacteria bacterium]|uniref:Protein O-mannosyl-transferase family n=1 Tax=Eiseniibacteriota bacterium TaxID=2212470 RepID=A0ABV6YJW9_UNCEI
MASRPHRRSGGAAAAVFAVAMVLYTITASRQVVFGDTPELIAAATNLGLAHPSGYPLLTLLGKAVSLIPIGSVAFRLSLLSGFFAAFAAAGICLLGYRVFGRATAAILGGIAFSLIPVLWENATTFEVYALNAMLMVTSLVATAAVWLPTDRTSTQRQRLLCLATFLIGLGISHHLTFVTILPALAWLAYRQRGLWFPKRGQLITPVLTFLLGLSPWLYLPVRGALSYDGYTCWSDLNSLGDVMGHMTARQYGTRVLGWSLSAFPILARRNATAFLDQLGWFLIFVPFGLAAIRGRFRVFVEVGILFLVVNLLLFFGYAVGDYTVFFFPAYLGLILLCMTGMVWLVERMHGGKHTWTQWGVFILAAILLVIQLPGRYAGMRRGNESFPMVYVRKLAATLPPDAVLVLAGQWKNLDFLSFPIRYAKRNADEITGFSYRVAKTFGRDKETAIFMNEAGASDALIQKVLAQPESERVSTFLKEYDGQRPLFTDTPDLFERAGLGAAYNGYMWRIQSEQGYRLDADPESLFVWVRTQAGKEGADRSVHANLATPLLNYVHFLIAQDRHAEALLFAERTAAICPEAREPQVFAALAAMRAGNHGKAKQLCDALIETFPYSSRGYLVKGLLLLNEQRYHEALAALDAGLAVDRVSDDDDMRFAKAVCYLGLGRPEEARKSAGPDVWTRLQTMREPQAVPGNSPVQPQ